MTREELIQSIQSTSQDIQNAYLADKATKLDARANEKLQKLSGITGLYDADSPTIVPYTNELTGKPTSTTRLTGDGYYVQAPELKVNDQLNPAGINARIQADNYAMGVDAPNFPTGEGLEPQYYQQYIDAMNPAIQDRSVAGEYNVTDTGDIGKYGRKLIQAQSTEMPMSQTDYLLSKEQGKKVFTQPKSTGVSGLQDYFSQTDSVDSDGKIGESIDIAQSSLIQQYGKLNKALRKSSRVLADTVGLDKETVDKWLPKAEDIGTIGFGDTTSTQLATPEVADKITGVMAKTREEQQVGNEKSLKAIEDGDYLKATWEQIKILPYTLGDSTGEIASLMAGYPGVMAAVTARVSEDAETYEKNNKEKPDNTWLLGSTLLNAAALLGEKLLINSGVSGVLEKGIANSSRVGKTAASTVGEAAQEYFDQTQQMYMTQKEEDDRTLGEIATSPEAQLAALAGGTMGGVLSATGQVTAEGLKQATELPGKVVDATDKYLTGPNEITQEALRARETAVQDMTPENVKANAGIVKKNLGDIDEGIDDKIGYEVIFSEGLKRAAQAEDPIEIEKIYQTMAELDADPDSTFSMKDYANKEVGNILEEFAKVVNKKDVDLAGKADAMVKSGKAAGEAMTPKSTSEEQMKMVESILAKTSMKKTLLKKFMGSDEYSDIGNELDGLESAMKAFLEGKDIDAVNTEVMKTGFMAFDPNTKEGKLIGNKHGVQAYYNTISENLGKKSTQKHK